ncbi:MAG: hypothetical protein LBP81_04815 [Treponema sp.]|jgi:hypothetical protein|nr:hypothetical protein [Treponema sp.]
MQEKKAVARQAHSRCQKAGGKENSAILDEFIQTTGCKNRKYALRILNKPEVPQTLLVVKGKAVKLKPAQPKPPNRAGKKIYTDEVIASLRLIWTFFWYKAVEPKVRSSWPPLSASKCPSSLPGPPSALPPPSGISSCPSASLPSTAQAALKLKGKSFTKPGQLLKHRLPIRTFYSSHERKLPGFIQIDTGRL